MSLPLSLSGLPAPIIAQTRQATEQGVPAQPGGALQDGTGTPGQPPAGGAGGMGFFWILILMLVFMILLTSMSGRKQRKRRAEMLGGLGRNDKVQMIGGEIGTIVEMKDDEVVLETGSSKIRFSRQAVQQVLRSASGGVGPAQTVAEPTLTETRT